MRIAPHPRAIAPGARARIQSLVALESVGQPISEIWPHLAGFCDLVVQPPDSPEAQEPADVVFFATPDTVGMKARTSC